jgi:hypothetical protein
MSDTKFKPGPWYAVNFRANSRAWKVTADLNNAVDDICNVLGWFPEGIPEANARLIAAAPDLYAALDEVMLYLPDFADDDQPAIVNAVKNARAALAKARGE